MWEVLLSPDAQNFLDKKDKQTAQRLRKGLEKLKGENPFHYLEHYESKDYYKYRMGDYRALVDADFANKMIIVRVIDHRGTIYKR